MLVAPFTVERENMLMVALLDDLCKTEYFGLDASFNFAGGTLDATE